MLFMLGPVEFSVAPLNATSSNRKGEYDFAEHKPLGAAPIYEDVGEGERKRTIKGATFPNSQDFRGGLFLIELLEDMRRSGAPQHLMRGDGTPIGWFLITSLDVDEEFLDFDGVPSSVKFDIGLTNCDAPSVVDIGAIIGAFFS